MTISMSGFTISGGARLVGQDPPPPPPIVTDGLIMQLDADNSSSYPGTGSTVFDLTGSFNHTFQGATFVTVSGIKTFDVSTNGSRLQITNSPGPTLPGVAGYTYVIWARYNNPLGTGLGSLVALGNDNVTPIFRNGSTNLGLDNNGTNTSTSTSVPQNQWRQYSVVANGSTAGNFTCTYYINGTSAGTINPGDNLRGQTHRAFGNRPNSSGIWGIPWGYVAVCLLYNRTLSGAEITTNFNAYKARFGQ